jgi:hypothetical protein
MEQIMPTKVAVLSFPTLQTTPNRIHDPTEFRNQAMSIISRNQRKGDRSASASPLLNSPPGRPNSAKSTSMHFPSSPVFSSGPDGNVDQAFKNLRSAGFNTFEKIYVLSHGHPAGLVCPQRDGTSKDLNAQELAIKFMDIGGMRDTIKARFEPVLRHPNGGKADYRTRLRLLSCETGLKLDDPGATYTTRSAKSYLHDLANQIGKQIIKTLTQLGVQYPETYMKSNFSLEISFSAPKGWNLVMPSGENVVYHSDSAHEQAADKVAKAAYMRNLTKTQMYGDQRIAPFIKANDQKKLMLKVRVEKFRGGIPYGETIEA